MAKKDKQKKRDKSAKEKPEAEKAKDGPVPGELLSDLTRSARSMRTFLTNSLVHSGLYAGQDGVILALDGEEGLTAGQIATRLGVKPPTMTRTLSRMEAQGFVRKLPGAADGRLVRAALTEEGRKHVSAIQLATKATEAMAFEGLSEKEIRQFGRILRRINRNMAGKPGVEDGFGE
ncbi:MAG: hypothetical protein RLZZ444_3632 [Pseudomonadota bacterium]|jgi:DNA-binding MarR family transcriptional regulator